MFKQNLKIGDKLLCKIDYWTTKIYFFEGREYNICDIEIDYADENDYAYFIMDENKNRVLFMILDDLDSFFYTKKEVRNIKIKKLKNA